MTHIAKLDSLFSIGQNRQMNSQRQPNHFVIVALSLMWLVVCAAAFAQDQQPESLQASVNQAIHDYFQQAMPASSGRRVMDIGNLDYRLQFAPCEQALLVERRTKDRWTGRLTLRVQCPDTPGWSIHVPVQVQLFDQVVVAKNPLPKGTLLRLQDLELQEQDVSLFHQGYFNDRKQLTGYVAKRPIRVGQVVDAAMLDPVKMVERGEQVVIKAEKPGMLVRTSGIALDAGAFGELIRVRNKKSQRVVEGRIVGPGQIQVAL